LLSDPERRVIKKYGAEKGATGTKGISYLIDPEGNVAEIYSKVDPELHADQVLEDVESM